MSAAPLVPLTETRCIFLPDAISVGVKGRVYCCVQTPCRRILAARNDESAFRLRASTSAEVERAAAFSTTFVTDEDYSEPRFRKPPLYPLSYGTAAEPLSQRGEPCLQPMETRRRDDPISCLAISRAGNSGNRRLLNGSTPEAPEGCYPKRQMPPRRFGSSARKPVPQSNRPGVVLRCRIGVCYLATNDRIRFVPFAKSSKNILHKQRGRDLRTSASAERAVAFTRCCHDIPVRSVPPRDGWALPSSTYKATYTGL